MNNRNGFAMVTVVFAMAILSVLAVAVVSVATDDLKASGALRTSSEAFYDAEAGLNIVWSDWSKFGSPTDSGIIVLNSGDTTSFSGTLPNGGVYNTVVTRVDDSDVLKTYLLTTEARTPEGFSSRVVSEMFQIPTVDFDIAAALTTSGSTDVGGSATIDGADMNPFGWPTCAPATADTSAMIVSDADSLSTSGPCADGSCITGGIAEDSTATEFGFDFDELVGYANKIMVGDTTYSDILPSFNGTLCNFADPTNWGEPLNETILCGDYFPVIYVPGDAHFTGTRGQGILLVDGDLRVQGGFTFNGVVIVTGTLQTTGTGAHFNGGVVVMNENNESNDIRGNATINYSACAIEKARNARLAVVKINHSWTEVIR